MAEENKLGKKIVALREAHHLSQQDLADRCEADVETIAGLEAGELPPSLAPLIKITRALGVRLGTLMDDDEQHGPSYIDSIITVKPSGETTHKLTGHEGEEWLYGLEGEIEIEYGKELYVLHPGESIYYDSIVPHQVRAHNNQTAKFLACVYTPI